MVDLEKLGQEAMQIIAYSGVAKSNYVEALQLAKRKLYKEAEEKIQEGDNIIKNAHDSHMELLQKEASENAPQVSMLVLHAEDQFMSCETIKLMALEIIELYKCLDERKEVE